MLPVMLDLKRGPVILYGDGPAAVRRYRLLVEAGATHIRVFSPAEPSPALSRTVGTVTIGAPEDTDIADAIAVFVADVPDAAVVAARARALRVLVNVEDDTRHCDFYTPSVVRRGDLVIAISTGGKSPGLARLLRQRLEGEFGPEWGERLARIGEARATWRAEGLDLATVAARTRDLVEKEGWI
ncbi:MAG: siroheme synthase [Alphaproteobacteria bacterium]|nr:MAG: siroheme synthase [Alphaproteobacteria bacterium]